MLVNQNMFEEGILPGAIVRDLSEEEMNVYREPFLDPADRKSVWRWPNELPTAGEPPDTAEAVDANFTWLQQSNLQKILFHATPGAIHATHRRGDVQVGPVKPDLGRLGGWNPLLAAGPSS